MMIVYEEMQFQTKNKLYKNNITVLNIAVIYIVFARDLNKFKGLTRNRFQKLIEVTIVVIFKTIARSKLFM